MRRKAGGYGLGALLLAGAFGAEAQPSIPSDPDAFLAAAARAADLYSDQGEALADGFRRLGPDFPGMGVHWVQTGRIVAGVLDGERPAVLSYANLDGRPTLVGLAYTLPLRADESPPALPFGREVWHDHSEEVSEESFLLSHPSSMLRLGDGFRLSMLHVWLPLANADGVLAQNNWALPFLRAGIAPPERPGSEAARGISLGSAGTEYYRELLHHGAEGNASDRASIDRVLDRVAIEVDAWIERHRRGASFASFKELDHFWHTLWAELERSVGGETYARILPLRSGH